MCKIQMRPDRVYRSDVLETLSNDSGSKKGKKDRRKTKSILHTGAQKAASQQKTIYIKRESNTLTVGHYSSVLMGYEMSTASSTVGLKTKE